MTSHRKPMLSLHSLVGFFTTLLASAIIGGVGYAWNTNADLAVLQKDVKQIKDTNIDVRMSVLEESFKNMTSSMDRQEKNLNKISDKIDRALERK